MDNFLSIKEAVNKYIDGCEGKISASPQKLFLKSIFAGMMIAMGAAASSVAAHAISNVGVARMAAALVFPVGLMMVILLGAELFTGDCLMIMATASQKHTPMQLVRTLVIVFAGNFVGAVLIAIAVLMALCAKDIAGKLMAVFFTIMLFVVAGFEHCVANMYYIAAGMVAAVNPEYVEVAIQEYGYTAEQISMLNFQNFFVGNLLPVTIGNIIGGMLFIGLPLLYLNREQKTENYRVKEKSDERGFIFRRNIAGIVR